MTFDTREGDEQNATKRKGGKQKKHLAGVGAKEQRQYEHIKESAEKEGRYGNRAKEVAPRTVLKQHKKKGHQKGAIILSAANRSTWRI
jgi:hypothetical protein